MMLCFVILATFWQILTKLQILTHHRVSIFQTSCSLQVTFPKK